MLLRSQPGAGTKYTATREDRRGLNHVDLQGEGAACQRGSGSLRESVKHNVDHNCLCQPVLSKRSSLLPFGVEHDTRIQANLLN